MQTRLPMGIENFKRIRTEGYYYVDKTGLIRDLLQNQAYVSLFTRPRRFGKTLNMSMLKYFFEIESDIMPFNNATLFDGLEIAKESELCEKNMGRFPVISITLKGATGVNFEEARGMLRHIIGNEAMRFQFLLQSVRLTEMERRRYEALISIDKRGAYTMSDELLKSSLQTLSQLLHKHYGQSVVMLIDEYDVPLDKAYQSGYYDSMVELIRVLFGNAFKTNDSLHFAVLTGCLRISKESIFTGLNNFNVYTVKDVQYNEYFGFTDTEVRQMLEYYGFKDQYDAVREWYDGYRFGELNVYCPWDVVSYCHALKMEPSTEPQNYWVNTSSNDIIRRFLSRAKTADRNEIEQLINGNSIRNSNTRKAMKENFYHGILLGLFANMDGWDVQSNAESGDGYSDISVEIEDQEMGIIIELKYAEKAAFDAACQEALDQINDRNYAERLIDDGMTTIRRYGIACYKRRCKVISGGTDEK